MPLNNRTKLRLASARARRARHAHNADRRLIGTLFAGGLSTFGLFFGYLLYQSLSVVSVAPYGVALLALVVVGCFICAAFCAGEALRD